MSTGKHRRGHHNTHKGDNRGHAVGVVGSLANALSEAQKIAHRSQFLAFLAALTGTEVEVALMDGRSYSGIFYTATPFSGKKFEIAIRAAKPLDKTGRVMSSGTVEIGSTMVIPYDKIVSLKANKINSFDKRKGSAHVSDLDVDSSIKNQRRAGRGQDGRQLESVDASWLASDTVAAIDATKEPTKWDQFETNRRLYNVKSTYDENIYTKPLDRTAITREQMNRAERIAHEIEHSYSTNVHMQEERGQLQQQDFDEEDMYSGVIRESSDKKPPPRKGVELQGQWRRGGPDVSAQASPRQKKVPKAKLDAPPGLTATAEAQKFASKTPSPALPTHSQQESPVVTPATTARTTPAAAAAAPSPTTTSASPATVPTNPSPVTTAAPASTPAASTPAAVTEVAAKSASPAPEKPTPSATDKPATKLNPNAKEFTLRPTATEFKPGGSSAVPNTPSSGGTSPRHHDHHHNHHHHRNKRHYPRGAPYNDNMMYAQQGYMPPEMMYYQYEMDPNMMHGAPPPYYGMPMPYYGEQMLPPPYMHGMPPPPHGYEHPHPPVPPPYSSPAANPHSSPRSKASQGNRSISGDRTEG